MLDSTVTDLDGLYEKSRSVKRQFEPQAFLNLAYYEGRQWVMFDGRQLFEPRLDPSRSKITDNRIKPVVRKEVAKMTKTRPTFIGVPRTQSDEDVSSARFTEEAFEWEWRQQQLTAKRRAALLWSRIAFAGFWKIWWDKTRGDPMDLLVWADGHELQGKAVKDQYGAPMKPDSQLPEEIVEQVQPKTVNMGDLQVDVKTFFEIFPDPLASEDGLGSADWLIEEAVYSEDYVKARFNKDLKADSAPTAGIAESRLPTTSTATGDLGVKVREYWHKPSSAHPKGRYVCWAQNQVLKEGDNPYPWLPYVMFRGSPSPGRFWPSSVVTDLISPQTELNKHESQIADNAERIGNPPLVESAQAMGDFKWHGLPGERVVFQDTGSPNARPAFMDVPQMPGYVQGRRTEIEQSIREISSQHEVSSGIVPPGVTAASAINMLQEQDDTVLGPDIEDMENALADAGNKVLYLLKTYATDERLIRIAGDDGAWDIAAFKGERLAGCDRIEVQAGSGMPQSKAAEQAQANQMLNLLIQNGKAPDERTLRNVMQAMQVGGLEKFFADIGVDVRQVNDENRRLALGEEVGRNSFDNDEIHVAQHDEWRKGAAYQRAVRENPQVAEGAEAHVQEHKAALAEKAAQLALAQMAPQGPGGGQNGQNGSVPPTAALPSIPQPST